MTGPLPTKTTPLSRILTTLNLTTGDLARALDAKPNTVSKWRRGITRPSPPAARALESFLEAAGVDAEVLVGLWPDVGPKQMRTAVKASEWWGVEGKGTPFEQFLNKEDAA